MLNSFQHLIPAQNGTLLWRRSWIRSRMTAAHRPTSRCPAPAPPPPAAARHAEFISASHPDRHPGARKRSWIKSRMTAAHRPTFRCSVCRPANQTGIPCSGPPTPFIAVPLPHPCRCPAVWRAAETLPGGGVAVRGGRAARAWKKPALRQSHSGRNGAAGRAARGLCGPAGRGLCHVVEDVDHVVVVFEAFDEGVHLLLLLGRELAHGQRDALELERLDFELVVF